MSSEVSMNTSPAQAEMTRVVETQSSALHVLSKLPAFYNRGRKPGFSSSLRNTWVVDRWLPMLQLICRIWWSRRQ